MVGVGQTGKKEEGGIWGRGQPSKWEKGSSVQGFQEQRCKQFAQAAVGDERAGSTGLLAVPEKPLRSLGSVGSHGRLLIRGYDLYKVMF